MTAYPKKSHICFKGKSKGDFSALQKKGHSNFAFKLIQFYLTIYISLTIYIVLLELEFFLQ